MTEGPSAELQARVAKEMRDFSRIITKHIHDHYDRMYERFTPAERDVANLNNMTIMAELSSLVVVVQSMRASGPVATDEEILDFLKGALESTAQTELSFYTQRCKHQAPLEDTCGAGVSVRKLLEQYPKHRLPCCDHAAFSAPMAPCAKLERYTEEEASAAIAALDRAVAAFAEGKCPTCSAQLETQQRGRHIVWACRTCKKIVGSGRV
jgi:hypothetical protein